MLEQRKTCTKCGEEKPFDEFYQNKSSPDGRHSKCKPCKSEQARKHYWENRERIRTQQKLYESENKDRIKEYRERNKDSIRLYQRKYRKENKDALAAKKKVYYQINREKILSRDAIYRETNREKILHQKRVHWEENRDRLIPIQRQNYLANREERLANNRLYYSENAEILNDAKSIREKEQNEVLQHLATRAGRRWNSHEDKILLSDDDTGIYEKAVQLGRTIYACRARLASLRKELRNAA